MTGTETPAAPASEPSKRLLPAEWEQVVVLWESGSVTLQDLSDRFGISKPSLHEGLKKRGAVKGSRAKEFAKATEESLKSEAQRRGEEIKGFKKNYQKFGDYIMQSAIVELQALRTKPRADRTREENARIFTSIKYCAEIFQHVRDAKFHLYDLYNQQDEETDLPDIGVTQYTEEEMETIRNRLFKDSPLLEEDDTILEAAREALGEMGDPEAP